MNALSLYVTTCRMVLQSGVDDASAWADISRFLSCLRQALTCSVCGKLLNCPNSSSSGLCHHSVCKCCIGGKMRLNPSCDLCSDYDKFQENLQLRIILQCYKKLCEYIISSALHRKWGGLNGGTSTSLADIVNEGAEISSDYRHSQITHHNALTLQYAESDFSPFSNDDQSPDADFVFDGDRLPSNFVPNGNSSVYSVMVADSNSTKIMIKRTATESSESETNCQDGIESVAKYVRVADSSCSTETLRSLKQKKRGCRCGMATANPGKLTCCGQRCPCYVDGKACFQCRCKGCRNPREFCVKSGHVKRSQLTLKENSEIVSFDSKESLNGNGDIKV